MPLQEEQNDTSEEGSSGNSAVETSSNVVDERNPSVGKDHNYF